MTHLSLGPRLVGSSYLGSSLRPNFLGGNVPTFFYHVFSLCLPLPLLLHSLLLGIMGSRKMRELRMASSLGHLVPSLRLHHLK